MQEQLVCKNNQRMTETMSMALDGLLDEGKERELQDHLVSCSQCQAEWKAMQQVSFLFEQEPMVGPPLGFAIRVERRLDEKTRKRRRTFGGIALLTGSLSLAGVTVAVVALMVVGIVAWQNLGTMPDMGQSTQAVGQVASGMGLVGKGASLFLLDLLSRYGPPLVLFVGIGLVFFAGLWAWLFIKKPGDSHRNGYA